MSTAPLHVIGLGPGSRGLLAPDAAVALAASRCLFGYTGYISLVPEELLRGKEVLATGMTGEIPRARAAIEAALAGRESALVCSGDPGVYALSGLVLELLEGMGLSPDALPLDVIPGIPALCAAAALLGAPLMHDFACVSLSDLLTPWERIARRLDCAFAGDFVVVLYNPRSRRRTMQLEEAKARALAHQSPATPVGIVRNACRSGQSVRLSSLVDFSPDQADMFTILVVGNASSRIVPGRNGSLVWEDGARMLTPRGYAGKYSLES